MRSIVTFLAFTSIYVCISLHNAEGCCCEAQNARRSDCNFWGCNCENLRNGYCLKCGRWEMGGRGSSRCLRVAPDYDDYCPDKRRKREINEWEGFSTMDLNQDGIILFEEALAFENITKMENGNPDFDWTKRQWALMDNNQDGYVTPKEVQMYLG